MRYCVRVCYSVCLLRMQQRTEVEASNTHLNIAHAEEDFRVCVNVFVGGLNAVKQFCHTIDEAIFI